MNEATLVLQQPAAAAQLILLFHGVGGRPADLAPLGRRLAAAFPQAAVVSVAAAEAVGPGFQWFAVQGVTEDNRDARVAGAMAAFQAAVRHWQAAAGVAPAATALVGFSQGAIMALESTQRCAPALAGRVVALSGRFAGEPAAAPPATTVHFVHGKHDPVMHYGHTVRAAERLIALGGDVTADVLPFVGHAVTPEVEDLVLDRLQHYMPQRLWKEAVQSAPGD